jgi:hypothetical protein
VDHRTGNMRFCRERAEGRPSSRAGNHADGLYLFGTQDGEIPNWVIQMPDWTAVAAYLTWATTG